MRQAGDTMEWRTVNGTASGKIVKVTVRYTIDLPDGKQMIIDEQP